MKKMIFILTLLMLSVSVFAQNQYGIDNVQTFFGEKNMLQSVQVREQVMTQMQNQEAVQALNQSINKFQEQYQNRYEIREIKQIGFEVDGEIPAFEAKVKHQGKIFGLIPAKVSEIVTINEETGDILSRQTTCWHRFMRFDDQ